ncbi:MAG: hypothetical protein EPO29_02630 [Betaproteobacteria bacterium]|nr:MAG: hypothetical protein EPO29_02630 [Betaproteobacteria bacterium]
MRLELRPSRGLAAALAAAHVLAGACLVLVVPGAAGVALAALAVGLGAATARERGLLRGRHAVRSIELQADGRASVDFAGGGCVPAAAGRALAGRYWVILELQQRSRRHLLVTGDMLDAAPFRQLRLWARWGRLPAAAAAPDDG